MKSNVPDKVKFVVPRIHTEHRADPRHVVLVVACVFHVLVPDGNIGEQLKVFRRPLANLFGRIEAIDK